VRESPVMERELVVGVIVFVVNAVELFVVCIARVNERDAGVEPSMVGVMVKEVMVPVVVLVHKDVLYAVHELLHERVPPVKPWVVQDWEFSCVPSQNSVPSLMLLGHI